MITIVMPFYKKLTEFIFAFDQYNFNEFNRYQNLELILSIDDPFETDELIDYLDNKTKSCSPNFAIIAFLNENSHAWRCPSSAINVGIKHARYPKILVMSPETVALPHSIEQISAHCDKNSFSFGIIKHISKKELEMRADNLTESYQNVLSPLLPHGSICFYKSQAELIGGYDESFIEWGGDDDDFRERLIKAGFRKKPTFAKFMHIVFKDRELNTAKEKRQLLLRKSVSKKIKQIAEREGFIANQGNYGNSYDKIVFEFSLSIGCVC